MINYRSLADLSDSIVRNLHRLPIEIDLVVGLPRSGMLAATMFSLITNTRLTDLDSLVQGRAYASGFTKRTERHRGILDARHILILDDSINGGGTMRAAKRLIADPETGILDDRLIFGAVYGLPSGNPDVDFVFETVKQPRIFQWNLMHHNILDQACVDIDGVLWVDPGGRKKDGGEAYGRFLRDAVPLHRSSRRIGCLITRVPEKYRPQTEAWLKSHAIEYGQLFMPNITPADERKSFEVHDSFKAEIYRTSNAPLLIVSAHGRAEAIARLSGKPVLCTQTNQMYAPNAMSPIALRQRVAFNSHWHNRAARDHLMRVVRNILGETGVVKLKSLARASAVDDGDGKMQSAQR